MECRAVENLNLWWCLVQHSTVEWLSQHLFLLLQLTLHHEFVQFREDSALNVPAIIRCCWSTVWVHHALFAVVRVLWEQLDENREGNRLVILEEMHLERQTLSICNFIYMNQLTCAELFSQLSAVLLWVDKLVKELMCIQIFVLNHEEARQAFLCDYERSARFTQNQKEFDDSLLVAMVAENDCGAQSWLDFWKWKAVLESLANWKLS